jgi:hypothetical protein
MKVPMLFQPVTFAFVDVSKVVDVNSNFAPTLRGSGNVGGKFDDLMVAFSPPSS